MSAKGVALLLLLAVAGASAQGISKKDLVTAIKDNAQLTELYTVLSKFPDLVEALTTFTGTLFVPNNIAFKKAIDAAAAAGVTLDDATLKTILTYHAVPEGAFFKKDLTDGQTLTTLEGSPLTVKYVDGAVTIEGAGSTANILREWTIGPAAVHLIDTVLLPDLAATTPSEPAPEPTPAEGDAEGPLYPDLLTAAADNNLTLLIGAVGAAGLEDALGPDFNGTVFAPTNEAFNVAIAALGADMAAPTPEMIAALAEVLKYHVIPGAAVLAADLEDGQELTTLQGDKLVVTLDGEDVYLESSTDQRVKVVAADVTAGDAVVHVVDTVLIPAAVVPEAPLPNPAPPSAASNTLASMALLAGSLMAALFML